MPVLRFSWPFLRILRYLISPRESSWKEQDPNNFPTHNTDQIPLYFFSFPQLIELFSMALTTQCSFPNIVLYGIILMRYGLRAFNMFLSQILLSIWKSTYNVKPWLAFKTIDSILSFKDIFYKLRSLIIILLCNFAKQFNLLPMEKIELLPKWRQGWGTVFIGFFLIFIGSIVMTLLQFLLLVTGVLCLSLYFSDSVSSLSG